MSRIVVAWIWVWQATLAAKAIESGTSEPDFYKGKLHAARYWIRRELPQTGPQAALLTALDDTCLAMEDAWF